MSRRGSGHLGAALGDACRITGADRAALATQHAPGRFAVTAATHHDDVGVEVAIGQLVSPLWPVLLRRTTLEWDAGAATGPRPLPLAGREGWRHLHARGLPFERGRQGLLVLGRDDRPFDDLDPSALDVVGRLCVLGVDNQGLRSELAAVQRMLTAAVHVAARTVDANAPAAIRDELLKGLVTDMGMAGAVLWEPTPDGTTLEITQAIGLPVEVRAALERPSPDSVIARLHRADLNARLVRGASAHASTLWPGKWVRLVRVGPPATGVLAAYADSVLPEVVDAVMATLSQALSRAVQQAVLHERTQQIADALVTELRPRSVGLPPGVQVGVVYRSATRGVPVGGDFYDWFSTPGAPGQGHTDGAAEGLFGIVCGDVSGKGLEAASLTTMVVHSLRAFAVSGVGPGPVLTALNGALCSQTDVERFATMAYGLLDPANGRLRLALAGHPVPVLVRGGHARLVDVAPDLPAGMFSDHGFVEHDLRLDRGDSLVLVTDGVTEARRRRHPHPFSEAQPVAAAAATGHGVLAPSTAVVAPAAEGDDELLGERGLLSALMARDGGSAQQLAEAVWEAVVEWTGGATSDDCAIVVVGRR